MIIELVDYHGRTLSERTKVKVHLNHIRTLCENATIPIIANDDINTFDGFR